MAHPVIDLLHARRAAGSRPGARADSERLALVVEGGGMRGVVSSAMTQVLEEEGFTSCFDLVVGCSAGALNAAALLAGVARGCTVEYAGAFASRRFINPARLLLGRPAVDVEYVLDHAGEHLDAARHARTLASPIPLHCLATAVDSAQGEDLTDFQSLDELRHALLASSRLPWVGGTPVHFRGRAYLDGGLVEAIPLRTALHLGATHALVLQTRPEGLRYPASEGFAERIVERRLRALNPALVDCYRARGRAYDQASDEVQQREGQRGSGPFVLGVRLPAGTPSVSRLEKRADVLLEATRVALEHTRAQLA